MAGMIYEFIENLKKETEYYDALVKLATAKKTHIIKGDVDRINEINLAEEDFVMKLKGFERKRNELMSDIASILNLNPKTITITNIAEAMSNQPEEATELLRIKDSLSSVINRLKSINGENMELIRQSLEYAEFSINVLQSQLGLQSVNANYSGGGNERGQSIFDTKQ